MTMSDEGPRTPRILPLIGAPVLMLALGASLFALQSQPPTQAPAGEPPEEPELPERFVRVAVPEADKSAEPSEEIAGGVAEPAAGGSSTGSLSPKARGGEQQDALFSGDLDASLVGGIGGLVGAKGTQLGSGGLGSRGAGIGGGGGVEGLGGLGTKGIGSGSSGYGMGSGYVASRRSTPVPPRSPVTQVDGDALSTFSIDVDTGSYTAARAQLRRGYLPSASTVRTEEFVNYLPYDYPVPRTAAFQATFEGSPSPWSAGRTLVRVGLQGRRVAADAAQPSHLTFLVDVSGSMQAADKLPMVQDSLHTLIDELDGEDSVAIVTYAGRTERVIGRTSCADKGTLHAAVDMLRAGGGTAMGDGVVEAYRVAAQAPVSGVNNRVIVLSDGDANIGRSGPDGILGLIEEHAGQGIALTTVGFGSNGYNDHMMERLADAGDGAYHFVDSEREAERLFVDRLTSTLEFIARDVKIQVEWDSTKVVSYRLVGYENRAIADKDFRNDAVDAGEVGSGHQVTALYELELQSEVGGDLGELRIRYKAPGPDAPAAEVNAPLSSDLLRSSLKRTSRDFRMAAATAWFAEGLRDDRSLAGAIALAEGAARAEYPEHGEALELMRIASKLRGETESAEEPSAEAILGLTVE